MTAKARISTPTPIRPTRPSRAGKSAADPDEEQDACQEHRVAHVLVARRPRRAPLREALRQPECRATSRRLPGESRTGACRKVPAGRAGCAPDRSPATRGTQAGSPGEGAFRQDARRSRCRATNALNQALNETESSVRICRPCEICPVGLGPRRRGLRQRNRGGGPPLRRGVARVRRDHRHQRQQHGLDDRQAAPVTIVRLMRRRACGARRSPCPPRPPTAPQTSATRPRVDRPFGHRARSISQHFSESGERVSNPRPRAWEARALPTELPPRCGQIVRDRALPFRTVRRRLLPILASLAGACLIGLLDLRRHRTQSASRTLDERVADGEHPRGARRRTRAAGPRRPRRQLAGRAARQGRRAELLGLVVRTVPGRGAAARALLSTTLARHDATVLGVDLPGRVARLAGLRAPATT